MCSRGATIGFLEMPNGVYKGVNMRSPEVSRYTVIGTSKVSLLGIYCRSYRVFGSSGLWGHNGVTIGADMRSPEVLLWPL